MTNDFHNVISVLFVIKIWRPPRKSGLTPKTTKARVICKKSIAQMVFGSSPLFLGGLLYEFIFPFDNFTNNDN